MSQMGGRGAPPLDLEGRVRDLAPFVFWLVDEGSDPIATNKVANAQLRVRIPQLRSASLAWELAVDDFDLRRIRRMLWEDTGHLVAFTLPRLRDDGSLAFDAQWHHTSLRLSQHYQYTDGLTYLHELTPDLYTASRSTFIGEVYGLFGLENIADKSKVKDDYPKLSKEYVVDADPDLVFLADSQCCGVSVADVAERSGWAQVAAVDDEQVHVVDEDVASRWGPRVVDFVQQVSEILAERESALGGADG